MSPQPPSRRWPVRLRRQLWRWRRVLLIVVVAAVGHRLVGELRPPDAPTLPVVVASRQLAAGAQLGPGDLRIATWPLAAHSAGLLADPQELLGRRLAVGVAPDLPVTRSHTVGAGLAGSAAPGSAVVIVPIVDAAVAALLRPGDRVDLVAITTDAAGITATARVVARDVDVLAHVPRGGGGILGAPEADSALLVVAVAPDTATDVIAASAWAPLRVMLRS